MNYDSFVTAAIAKEAQALVGAFVDHIAQPTELELFVTFYTGRAKARWVFSADARLARVHGVAARPENPPAPPNFCMVARKWIDGARLAAVRQVGFDRVLRWEFERSDGRRTLIAEVMGKHSNLVLVDETETILGAIKRVPASVSRARQVLPGLPYTPPPERRLDPLTIDRQLFLQAVGSRQNAAGSPGAEGAPAALPSSPSELSNDLVRLLAGFGPFAAAEVLARSGGSDLEAVWAALDNLMAAAREGRFEPTVFYRPTFVDTASPVDQPATINHQPPGGFWAFRSAQLPAAEQAPVASMSAAADRFFGAIRQSTGEEEIRRELLAVVRKERERLERLARRLEEDLRRGDEAEQWKIAGDLLAANLWRVQRGQTVVEVPNYYDPEQRPLKIDLDGKLTPQENVERLFRRHRKGTDAALQAMEQSPAIAARLQTVRESEERVASASMEALPAVREELEKVGLLAAAEGGQQPVRSARAGRRPAPEFPPGVRIRRMMVDGWEVLLGENATSNDYLTTRVARPDDWWLHVRAAPSAHVVIRTGGHPERVPPAVLREAARITAAHSESKHSRYVPVDYVLRKYVRKPRGSAPGLVTLRGEKTLYVDPVAETAEARRAGRI